MNLGKATGTHFQSHPKIEFDYSALGLALISGTTGAGKSTVLDLPAWVLYGETSKDSSADSIRSWGAEEPTVGTQEVSTPAGDITVYRTRGKSAHSNDLYWIEAAAPDVKRRGKDAIDTQKLLEQRLGVTSELFFSGSYAHQFNVSEQFFIAKAKDRREALEKIADLSLPVRLAERASEARKTAKKNLEQSEQLLARAESKHETLLRSLEDNEQDIARWADAQASKVDTLKNFSSNFEAEKSRRVDQMVTALANLDKQIVDPADFDKRGEDLKRQLKQFDVLKADLRTAQRKLSEVNAEIRSKKAEYDRFSEDLGDTCPTCLGPAAGGEREAHVAELASALEALVSDQIEAEQQVDALETALGAEPKIARSYQDIVGKKAENQRLIDRFESDKAKINVQKMEKNSYAEQIDRLLTEKNPFEGKAEQFQRSIEAAEAEVVGVKRTVETLAHRVSSLTTVYDKSFELRGKLIEQAVQQLNDSTNEYLEKYFEAAIRVQFTIEDGDAIEVVVLNQGHECAFRQLSGGERTMLKLCFNTNYMQMAQNRAGVRFGTVMFDEPLRGLSDGLKERAFALFQALEAEHDSVLLIEHYSAFESMCANRFHVENFGGESRIEAVAA